jgi:recombination protein RecR
VLRAPPEFARTLAAALTEVVERVRLCPRCFSLHDGPEGTRCGFCTDARRDDRVVCVVENISDELAIERTREFKGRYHVLHGVLSPLEGVGPDQLRIRELLVRLEDAPVEEVIIATNPDVEGEATALYLTKLLKPLGLRVTRLAQGIPMGGDLEFADQATLARALSARREL